MQALAGLFSGRTSPGSRGSRTGSDVSVSTPRATPSSQQVEETLGFLISAGNIPREHVSGVAIKLREILESPDHRPYDQLIARASHPCVHEYLPEVFRLLDAQQRQVAAAASQFRGKDLDSFLQDANRQKETYYAGIAETLGRGFDVTLKPNLIFDSAGNPIGVRPTDRTRFPQCSAALSGAGGKRKKQRKTKKRLTKKRKTLRRIRH